MAEQALKKNNPVQSNRVVPKGALVLDTTYSIYGCNILIAVPEEFAKEKQGRLEQVKVLLQKVANTLEKLAEQP